MKHITLYHSADADDIFMFYGISSGIIKGELYEYSHEAADIQYLNQLAVEKDIECTALSVHAYAFLSERYAISNCGSSLGGEHYGPRLISRQSFDLRDGAKKKIGIPGELTSAALALRIYLKEAEIEAELVPMFFEKIQGAVAGGKIDAGVVIHEGQLTYQHEGLHLALDLGAWWWKRTGLPLPLGITVVNRSLGDTGMREVSSVLRRSVEYSLAHRDDALRFALSHGRGLTWEEGHKYIEMYVNDSTVDLGDRGREAIRLFLGEGANYGFIPRGEILFV